MLSLYLHFPFCKRKCSYCDFCSMTADESVMEAYCRALEKEIALTPPTFTSEAVDTVFLGGGTPSILPAPMMRHLLGVLRERFDIVPGVEFTSEANPGTLTDVWLDTLTEAGCNRLSIGVQAKQARLLNALGRIHDFPQALNALAMARKHGIQNLNADTMFGLPGQELAEYLETLSALAETGIPHLSAYSLIVEEGTPLCQQVERGDVTLPDEDATAEMLEEGIRLLARLGYERYEISNFAKPGFECKHNIGYWQQKQYLGLGLNAASMLPAPPENPEARYLRRSNTPTLTDYLRMVSEGRLPIATSMPVNAKEAMFETVMLGLRMVEGIRYSKFERMHGQSLTDVYGDAINRLTRDGLLKPSAPEEPWLQLTERGLAMQNTALMAFMNDP